MGRWAGVIRWVLMLDSIDGGVIVGGMKNVVCTDSYCCPEPRRAKGLPCFKTLVSVAAPAPEKSYEELKAENPGCAVIRTRSGMGHGPARWTVVRRGVSR